MVICRRAVGGWMFGQRSDLVTRKGRHRGARYARSSCVRGEVTPVEPQTYVAFVGTYPPRRCGIATFTRDLAAGMSAASARVRPLAVAVTEEGGEYEYPAEVEYEIRQGTKGDYARAAELINYKDVRWLSLQHEYGIFGGDDGAYVLDLLSALRVPSIVTLHTVLDHPSESQRKIVQKIARSAPLVSLRQNPRPPGTCRRS